ncbi:hypothetical protein QYM36_010763 [Artemia franciscana]|uniref:Reverse transcriptase domain-containing protein n=1 Tax=Artemia franciscana TaxID=6661 RepID=A0AA88L291_ARTSF|nr:hypothetical protein QYM36_010763 [Artemia franciscana]
MRTVRNELGGLEVIDYGKRDCLVEVLNVRRKKYEGDEFIEVYSGRATPLMHISTDILPAIVWNDEIFLFTMKTNPNSFLYATSRAMKRSCARKGRNLGLTRLSGAPTQQIVLHRLSIHSVPGIAAIARNQPNRTIKDLASSEAVDLVIEALEKESTRKDKPQKPKKKETEEQSGSQKNPSQEGRPKTSFEIDERERTELIRAFQMKDIWAEKNTAQGFTRIDKRWASRINRIHVSENLAEKVKRVENICVAFSDYLAIVIDLGDPRRDIVEKKKDRRVIGAYQHGGIKGKKAQHILSVLKELVMRGDRELRRLILQMDLLAFMSIDVVKAYESVVRVILWVLMERKYGMSRQAEKRFENLYKDPKVVVKVNGELMKEIEMEKALRQGDSLSPCLFEIYMEPLFKYVEIQYVNTGLPIMFYYAPVFELQEDKLKRIEKEVRRFIWKGKFEKLAIKMTTVRNELGGLGFNRLWQVLNEEDSEERRELSNALPSEFRDVVEDLCEYKGSGIFDSLMKAKTRKKIIDMVVEEKKRDIDYRAKVREPFIDFQVSFGHLAGMKYQSGWKEVMFLLIHGILPYRNRIARFVRSGVTGVAAQQKYSQ